MLKIYTYCINFQFRLYNMCYLLTFTQYNPTFYATFSLSLYVTDIKTASIFCKLINKRYIEKLLLIY